MGTTRKNRITFFLWVIASLLLFWVTPFYAQSLEFGVPISIADNFQVPTGLGIDATNNRVLVVNTGEHGLEYTTITDIEMNPSWFNFGFVADRTLPEALNEPQGVAIDANGHAYVVDTFNNEVKLFRWVPSGASYSYDASFASTTRNTVDGVDIEFPRDVAVGSDGKIYLLDSGNNRILVADGPSDTSWEVFHSNSVWGNPYGLDIAADDTIYIADTDNHRVVKLIAGIETSYGIYGVGNVQFRHPRDVAVGTDGRMYVADTYNHRIAVLQADGSHYRNLGSSPLFGTLQKIAVTSDNKIFVVDAQNNQLVAFLGPDVDPPYDAYIKDYVGDTGIQPSDEAFLLSSPDILIRHAPDINLIEAANLGLNNYAYQQPRFDENNYVYLGVRNRGTDPITNTIAKFYWADPSSPMNFPADWLSTGFYDYYIDAGNSSENNTLTIPYIDARQEVGGIEQDGVQVIGPIIWRPPAPETSIAGDGNFYMTARLINYYDPSEFADGLVQVRLNNNIALRRAEVTRGPFPIGEQNTLVIGTRFSDITDTVDETNAMDKVTLAGQWIEEVSYGQTIIDPYFAGTYSLDEPRSFYDQPDQSMLVDMATEILDKLLLDQPDILDGATADPDDDIDRLILVVNDASFTEDWATTGNWIYNISSGGQKYLSVSIQGPNNSKEQFAHGISHQLGLKDLYAYDNVTFPSDFRAADSWDNMAKPFEGAHPLAWSKEHATWVTSNGGKIHYIARPQVGSPITESPITISFQSILATNETGAVAIGLTPGITTFEEETHFYWVESRSNDLGNSDAVVPAKGVLIYYANKLIPQGQAPVIIRDNNSTTVELDDAVYLQNDSESPAGTGITINVLSERPDNEGYDIGVIYDPPPTDYDVYMNIGDPHWTSPDIWVDNQITGGGYHSYNAVTKKSGGPVDEQPVGGEENRIYARVHNSGDATAYDIEVQFHFSAPYHTVGGVGSFDFYESVFIGELPPSDYKDVYVVWQPESDEDPHNCVKVELRRMTNDINSANDGAQQNLRVISSDQASPYPEVAFPFNITNAEPQPQLVYFRAEGVPEDWSSTLVPNKALLNTNQKLQGVLRVTPKEGSPPCNEEEIRVTAWTPLDHTIVPLGGATVDLQLRNRTEINHQVKFRSCREGKRDILVPDGPRDQKETDTAPNQVTVLNTVYTAETYPFYINLLATILGTKGEKPVERGCREMITNGCTNPPRPFETVVIRYEDPAGNPIYKEVTTDANGCFEDFHVVIEGGAWETTAIYPGNDCSGTATSDVVIVELDISRTGDQDGDGLADDEESQGDHDGDGIPNPLDTDSDNDGIIDGEEPSGDIDNDGLDNANDPDSDGDGILDGDDARPYGDQSNTFNIAGYFGRFYFDNDINIQDNKTYGIRVAYTLGNNWSLEADFGWTPTSDNMANNGTVYNFSAGALYQFYFPSASKLGFYANSGIGLLHFNGFSSSQTAFAINAGLGASYHLLPKIDLILEGSIFYGSPVYTSPNWDLNYRLLLGIKVKL